MMAIEEKNAIITNFCLTNEEHGVLTFYLHLDYGGGGQSFGGWVLYNPYHNEDITGEFLWRVYEISEVVNISQLRNKPIRVRASHDKVHAIGHFLKDLWFYPDKEFAKDKSKMEGENGSDRS